MAFTRLRIVNKTNEDIIDSNVEVRSNEGWRGNNRPDFNFVHVHIPSHSALEQPQSLGKKSSVFTIALTFRDETEDKFSIDQKSAVDRSKEGLHLYNVAHDISWRREAEDVLVITIEEQKR